MNNCNYQSNKKSWGLLLLMLLVLETITSPCNAAFVPVSYFPTRTNHQRISYPQFAATTSSLVTLQPKTAHHSTSTTQLHLSPPEPWVIGIGVAVAGFAGWLYVDGADDRQRRNQRQEEEERYRQYQQQRANQAYVEPKDYWTEEELAQYNGTQDPDGPILLAADGLVFNVYKGRNFYGPGGEYHLFAGRDATRFLAKTIVEEESPEELAKPLTMAERAALAAWIFTFKGKYEIVGNLKDFDPTTTSMKSLL